MQEMVELCLVEVLSRARYLMRQTTKKKSDRSLPTRSTLLGRDLRTVLTILGPKHPIMSGRLRPARREGGARARVPARGSASQTCGIHER